jgi:type IV secretory pathway VirB4 component
MIGILNPTCVNQESYTITSNKDSEIYMNMIDFDKQDKELTDTVRSKVALYITKAIQVFLKDCKFLIKIPYIFK